MASGDETRKLVGIMLAAIVFIAAAADAKPEQQAGTCIGSISDVPGAGNPCICSKNCACAGKCILNAGGGGGDDVQTCFVECVLKNDCSSCPGPLPASLDKTVRLNVTRPPKASRGSQEKLVIGVDVEPRGTGAAVFDVYLNVPEGGEVGTDSQHYVWTFQGTPEKISNKVVHREIGDVLRTIGAAGDETIVVSLVPKAWGESVTILSVKIE